MKPCPNCSTQLHDDAVFCRHCQREIATVESTSSMARIDPQRVTVVDIDMPFGSMVGFMVKWAVATIPALLILGLVVLSATFVIMAIGLGS